MQEVLVMDNKINEIRRKIIYLREGMGETERAMRAEIAHDLDCSRTAQTLIGQRLQMAGLANERKALGDLTPVGLDCRKLDNRR
jgi:hypothetical protein